MLDETFQAYTKEVDAEQIVVLFERKYGYPPAQVEDGGTIWLAGPLLNDVEAEAQSDAGTR